MDISDIIIPGVMAVVLIAILLKGRAKSKAKDKAIEAAKPESRTWWLIGPDIPGYPPGSPGMPKRPTRTANGFKFNFPTVPTEHVHYVQGFDFPSLVGAKEIYTRFAVTGGGFVPQEYPDGRPATVCLIIQRKGDNWGAQGEYAAYRLYSSKVVNLAAGEHELRMELVAPLWGGVYGSKDQAQFEAALADPDNIAFGFGSAGGRGHGVFATEPSTFELLEFRVVR